MKDMSRIMRKWFGLHCSIIENHSYSTCRGIIITVKLYIWKLKSDKTY